MEYATVDISSSDVASKTPDGTRDRSESNISSPVAENLLSPQLSVVVALRDPDGVMPVRQLFAEYRRHLAPTNLRCEYIIVIDGDHPNLVDDALGVKDEFEEVVHVLRLARWTGDATALAAGFNAASGDLILTLPARHEVTPESLSELIGALGTNDMVCVRRWPGSDGFINAASTRSFHWLLNAMVGSDYHDISCSIRLFRREVSEAVRIYGDQHRFFPVLVSRYGFKVKEYAMPQYEEGDRRKRFKLSAYVSRVLDLLSVFFLVKFTKKPLRFFGISGLAVFGLGAAFSALLGYQRLFENQPLADRPALLLGLLLIVLGVQLFAIGIVGELIIFTHSKNIREYTVERIVN